MQAPVTTDGIGNVEVRPMIAEDVDFNEVDDRAVEEAVVHIAESAAQDECQGYGDEGEVVTEPDENDKDYESSKECKADQSPVNEVGGCGVGEERKGCTFVGPVGEAENAGNDGNVAAEMDVLFDPGFGPAIGQEDERGDEQKPGRRGAENFIDGLIKKGTMVGA